MGYFFAIAAIVVIPLLVVFFVAVRGGASPHAKQGDVHPVSPSTPAADEPSPGKSVTATPGQVAAAEKRVPPA